jgi:hypothetical protein
MQSSYILLRVTRVVVNMRGSHEFREAARVVPAGPTDESYPVAVLGG